MNVNSGKDPLLDAFDCPDPSVKTPRRGVTTTPLQALGLMNGSFVQRQAVWSWRSAPRRDAGGRCGPPPSATRRTGWRWGGRRPRFPRKPSAPVAAARERGLTARLLGAAELHGVRLHPVTPSSPLPTPHRPTTHDAPRTPVSPGPTPFDPRPTTHDSLPHHVGPPFPSSFPVEHRGWDGRRGAGVADEPGPGTGRDRDGTALARPDGTPAAFRSQGPKRVVQVFCCGGVSHLDTFDSQTRAGADCTARSMEGQGREPGILRAAREAHEAASMSSVRHGRSGAWVSSLLPHLAGVRG
jgi:hypothetical protein